MKAIQNLAIVIFFGLSVSVATAQLQVHYIKGTITTTDNTTIECYVKSISLSSLGDKISYKTDPERKEFDILGVGMVERVVLENGEEYKRVVFEDPDSKEAVSSLGRVLVKGTLGLYQVMSAKVGFYVLETPEKNYALREDKIVGTGLHHYYFKNLLAAATVDKPEMHSRAERTKYSEKELVSFVNDYNMLTTGSSTVLKATYQKARFLMVFGNYAPVTNRPEFLLQANARFYNVRFSHSLSLNVGLHYLHYQYDQKGTWTISGTKIIHSIRFTGNFVSIPIYAQENLLNGKFRPFIFAGLNLSYVHETDEYNKYHQDTGFQRTYGVSYLLGGGIEWNVTPNVIIKGMWVHEYLDQPVLLGIGYVVGR